MKISAGELTANHLGKTITCTEGGTVVTGVLCGIESSADVVYNGRLCEEDSRWAIGRAEMTLTIAPSLRIRSYPAAPVEIA